MYSHTDRHIRVYACVSVCLYLKMYYKCVNEATTTTIQFSTSIFRPIYALVNGFALSLLLATPVCSYLTKFCISFSIFNAANRLHMHTHTHTCIRSRSASSLAPSSLGSPTLAALSCWGIPLTFCRCNKLSEPTRVHTQIHQY